MLFKKILLLFSVVIITLLLSEVALRLFGFRPGVFRSIGGFEVVDSLILYKNYTTDEAGIYKFSPWVTDSLPKYINAETGEIDNPATKNNLRHSDKIEDVCFQFKQLSRDALSQTLKSKLKRSLEEEDWKTEFVKMYRAIKTKPVHDEWEEAILNYVEHPFNAEGFRSIEFKRHQTKRKRILVIGDSFVYGMSAKPFFNSFTDILLAHRYMVYSAGIPGTDPAQYAAVADKYGRLLQPDLVVFCFFSGNDLMNFYRESLPSQPHEYMTNAGFFESAPLGKFLSLQEAYNFYASLVQIPLTNSFNRLCAKTCLTTLCWNLLYKNRTVNCPAVEQSNRIQQQWADSSKVITKKYTEQAALACGQMQIPFLFTLIPDRFYHENEKREFIPLDTATFNAVFSSGVPYYFPRNLRDTDYAKNRDTHFNNSGSAKFAVFLDTLIQETLHRQNF